MGNCITSPTSNKTIKRRFAGSGKHLRIIKADGKVMEYSKPVLVEELLSNTSSLLLLPPDMELRTGKAYPLLPLGAPQFSGSPELKPPAILNEGEGESRRVKIVLTKMQFQVLLSMNVSLEELAYVAGGGEELGEGNRDSWKPELDTIFEEVE